MSEDYCRCNRPLELKGAVRVCSACKEPQDNCQCSIDRWWERGARRRGGKSPDAISRWKGTSSRGARGAVVALGIVCFIASVLVTPTLLQWSMQSYYEECQKPYCEYDPYIGTYCESGESVGKPSCEGNCESGAHLEHLLR
jgi:hypothetical protein